MASTYLSDINYDTQVFSDNLDAVFTQRIALMESGALVEVPDQIVSKDTKGTSVVIPRWSALSGDPDRITTGLSTTVNAQADMPNIAIWLEQEKAWGANQIVPVVAGKDPVLAVSAMIAEYWARVLSKVCTSGVLPGAFATALSATHSTGTTYEGSPISIDGGLTAKQKLGDNKDYLTLAIMHSKVHTDAVREKIVTYDKGMTDAYNSAQIGNFLGASPYVTDGVSTTSGSGAGYSTYFLTPGSLMFKFRNRPSSQLTNGNLRQTGGMLNIEIELARNSTTGGGQDLLISRASFFAHVEGMKWNTTFPEGGASLAELATGASWAKGYTDDKLIRVAELITA